MQSSSSPYGRQTWEAGTEAAVLSPYGSRTPIAAGRHFLLFLEPLRNYCEPLPSVFRPQHGMRRRLKNVLRTVQEMTAEAVMTLLNFERISKIRGAGRPASLADYPLHL
jgi:hypothetical protein